MITIHINNKPYKVEANQTIMQAADEETLSQEAYRGKEEMMPLNKRKGNFDEVVRGLKGGKAKREARRCLRCDLEKQ